MENIKNSMTTPTIKVKIKKLFEPKVDNYGKTKIDGIVVYNGTEYYGTFNQKQMEFAKEGREVIGIRKSYNGKFYYEWNPDETTPLTKTFERATAEPAKDITQERILKGMIYNNVSRRSTNQKPITILDMCKEEYEVMKDWLIS